MQQANKYSGPLTPEEIAGQRKAAELILKWAEEDDGYNERVCKALDELDEELARERARDERAA